VSFINLTRAWKHSVQRASPASVFVGSDGGLQEVRDFTGRVSPPARTEVAQAPTSAKRPAGTCAPAGWFWTNQRLSHWSWSRGV